MFFSIAHKKIKIKKFGIIVLNRNVNIPLHSLRSWGLSEGREFMSMWDCEWQTVMCWGLLKILCIVHACMCKLHICQHPHSYQVWSSQGFPHHIIPPSTHSPYHSVSSSCVPVFTACCSVWLGSGYRQSDDSFFQSPFINTAPRAFLTTKQCVSERGRAQRENVDA